jgi:hypothetical protein
VTQLHYQRVRVRVFDGSYPYPRLNPCETRGYTGPVIFTSSHELPLAAAGLRGGAVGLASTWCHCLGGVAVSAPVLLGVVVVLVVQAWEEVVGFEKMC